MNWLSDFNILNVGLVAQALVIAICVILAHKCTKYLFGDGKANSKHLRKPGTVGRCLGHHEEVLHMFSVDRRGTGNICAAMRLISKQKLSHQHVRDALVLLAKRQPMLRAVVNNMKNESKYFEIKDINEVTAMINMTTCDVNASDWRGVWFECTTKQLGNGLLWRLVILYEEFLEDTQHYANTLMFTFSHCCTDGVSSVKFCNQFLSCLNELANGTSCVDQPVSSLNLEPYFHDTVTKGRISHFILKFVLTYTGIRPIFQYFVRKAIAREFEMKKINPFYARFPPDLDVCPFAGSSRLLANVFTEAETKKIVEACKSNNCTVTGAIMTAAHLAFCQLIENNGNKNLKLRQLLPINARRHFSLKPHENYMGFFVYLDHDFYMNYAKDTDVEFWEVAQNTTMQLKDAVKNANYIMTETLMEEAMKPRELCSLDRKSTICSSGCNMISSFGSFNFAQSQDDFYKLNECFVNDAGHGFPDTFAHFNLTINGKMTWQIAYDISRIDSSHGEKFANLCFGKFLEIAQDRV